MDFVHIYVIFDSDSLSLRCCYLVMIVLAQYGLSNIFEIAIRFVYKNTFDW
nr:MAG TPA: hypothetical protein [Caudoviricetes sp.]